MNRRKNYAVSTETALNNGGTVRRFGMQGIRGRGYIKKVRRRYQIVVPGIKAGSKLHKALNRCNVLRGKDITLHYITFTFHLRSWKNSRK